MAEADRSFLGLTHNPFAEPYRGFFERGGRKYNLEQLRHLSQWSRRVLLVTGALGVGKTTLYRELAATLEPRVKAARISAGLVNAGREVLAAIAQGFGMPIAPGANSQSLRFDLIDHVEAQASGDRPCLVLVDDAHLLDNRAVDELITLTRESALHLVLFGEVRMVPVIERAASSRGVGWQEIRLSGYGEADARDYLEWRFQQAKYRGRIPFTDQQVRDLVKLSGGLPGRINQLANVLLVKLETGEVARHRGWFPRMHLTLLVLLVMGVGLLYVLFTEHPPREDTVALKLPPPADTAGGRDAVGPSSSAAQRDPQARPPAQPDPANVTGEDERREDAVDALRAVPPVAESPASADDAAMPGREDDESTNAPVVIARVDADRGAGAVQGDADAGVDEGLAEGTTSPAPEPSRSAPSESPEAADPPGAAPASDPASTGVRDTRWLLAQNPDYFTLQLVTVSAPERAQAFVARQQEPGEFAIYQLQRDNRVLHVVVYGLFTSRDAAEAAAENLPATVGDVQPWIRPLSQVQSAASQSLRQ